MKINQGLTDRERGCFDERQRLIEKIRDRICFDYKAKDKCDHCSCYALGDLVQELVIQRDQ